MAQRLLKVIVQSSERERLAAILEEYGREAEWFGQEGRDVVAVEALIPAEGMEPMLDAVESAFQGREPFRMILLPVEAAFPRPEEEGPKSDREGDEADAEEAADGEDRRGQKTRAPGRPPESEGAGRLAEAGSAGEDGDQEREAVEAEKEGPARISREELYSDVTDISGLSTYYLVMVGLSTVVASVGILRDNPAVIVGAMVIAPLLGPNMALALATTLGDVSLGREAIGSTSAGVAVTLAVSMAWGMVASVDPGGPAILQLTTVGYGELFLALAAGSAGVLSITRGTATALVGVMVAVALLPPLVACGLLLGAGELALAGDAAVLVAANVICVNLAGVVTFLARGVRPRRWWEADRARKATRIAIGLWVLLLVGLVLVIARAGGG